MSSNYLDLHTRTSKAMTDAISPETFTPLKPVPMVRIRISTDFQASTKRIEPSVTVEIVAPADGSVDETAFWKELETVRTAAMLEFANVLRNTEAAIAEIRPAIGEKS